MNKKLALAAGLTLAAFAAPSLAQAQNAFTTDYVNLRAGPGLEYPVVFAVQPSQPLTSYGCLDDWSWCDVSVDGYRGWMVGDFISYAYGGSYVPVAVYGPRYHLPIITFEFGTYWDRYYRDRPWYHDRDRWASYDWRRNAWNGPNDWRGRHDWDRWDGRRDNDRRDNNDHRDNNDRRDGDRHDNRWDNNDRHGAVQPFSAPGYGGQYRSQVDANRNTGRNDGRNDRNTRFGATDPSQHSGVNSPYTPQYRGNTNANADTNSGRYGRTVQPNVQHTDRTPPSRGNADVNGSNDNRRIGNAVRPDVQRTDRAVQHNTDQVKAPPRVDNNRDVQRNVQSNERRNNDSGGKTNTRRDRKDPNDDRS
jgi:uncharacterized protein YraI